MNAIYTILIAGAGLVTDWALFGRLAMILGAFGEAGDESLYRNTLWPRTIFTILASVTFAIAVLSEPERVGLVIGAGIIFFLANLYGVYLVFNGGGRS